jgi:hypothetical protein
MSHLGIVSFCIGCILLTKSLSCNVAVFTGMPYILESSSYLEFISLRWKEPYYDKFSVTSMKKSISEVLRRFCANSNSEKSDPKHLSRRPCKPFGRLSVSNILPDDVAIPSGRPSVSRKFKLFKDTPSRRNGKSSGHSSEFKKNPMSKCIRPDDLAIPSGCHSVFDK